MEYAEELEERIYQINKELDKNTHGILEIVRLKRERESIREQLDVLYRDVLFVEQIA